MTPQTLWAVWIRTPDFFLANKIETDPVRKTWVLASPGDNGLAEIASPTAFQGVLVAALSLDMLIGISEGVDALAEHQSKTLLGRLPGRTPRICIVRRASGEVAIVPHRGKLRGDVELLGGGLDDIMQVVDEGRQIFETMDYQKVFDDLRPITSTHPKRWLFQKKDPAAFAATQKFMNEMGRDW